MACNNITAKEQYTEDLADMSQLITDDVMIYLNMYVNIVARFIISVVGGVTNLISMIIFSKLGLKDSMSVGLFSLSLTDFLLTCIELASSISFIIDIVCPNTKTDAKFVGYFTIGWAITLLHEMSCWITAMISVERCYCVVSPFKVKQVFTRYRCITVILTIYIVYIGIHVPIYIEDKVRGLESLPPSGKNKTTRISECSTLNKNVFSDITLVEFILDITAGVFIWLFSQAVVIVCAVWMGYSLEVSSKVRYNATHESQGRSESQASVYSNHTSTLSNRERRLVKVVLFLAITMTAFNVPKTITIIWFYTFPYVNTSNQENLNIILWGFAYIFVNLGCSVSFVVYMTLNANYRQKFTSLLKELTDS